MRSTIQRIDGIKQSASPQPHTGKQNKVRRRKSGIGREALAALDAAVEARGGTEEPSREWQLVRPDVQDEFAARTRKLVRQLQSELRRMLADINGRAA